MSTSSIDFREGSNGSTLRLLNSAQSANTLAIQLTDESSPLQVPLPSSNPSHTIREKKEDHKHTRKRNTSHTKKKKKESSAADSALSAHAHTPGDLNISPLPDSTMDGVMNNTAADDAIKTVASQHVRSMLRHGSPSTRGPGSIHPLAPDAPRDAPAIAGPPRYLRDMGILTPSQRSRRQSPASRRKQNGASNGQSKEQIIPSTSECVSCGRNSEEALRGHGGGDNASSSSRHRNPSAILAPVDAAELGGGPLDNLRNTPFVIVPQSAVSSGAAPHPSRSPSRQSAAATNSFTGMARAPSPRAQSYHGVPSIEEPQLSPASRRAPVRETHTVEDHHPLSQPRASMEAGHHAGSWLQSRTPVGYSPAKEAAAAASRSDSRSFLVRGRSSLDRTHTAESIQSAVSSGAWRADMRGGGPQPQHTRTLISEEIARRSPKPFTYQRDAWEVAAAAKVHERQARNRQLSQEQHHLHGGLSANGTAHTGDASSGRVLSLLIIISRGARGTLRGNTWSGETNMDDNNNNEEEPSVIRVFIPARHIEAATVADIKQEVARQTRVPAAYQQLRVEGVILKDHLPVKLLDPDSVMFLDILPSAAVPMAVAHTQQHRIHSPPKPRGTSKEYAYANGSDTRQPVSDPVGAAQAAQEHLERVRHLLGAAAEAGSARRASSIEVLQPHPHHADRRASSLSSADSAPSRLMSPERDVVAGESENMWMLRRRAASGGLRWARSRDGNTPASANRHILSPGPIMSPSAEQRRESIIDRSSSRVRLALALERGYDALNQAAEVQ